jgi:hypothetical protein
LIRASLRPENAHHESPIPHAMLASPRFHDVLHIFPGRLRNRCPWTPIIAEQRHNGYSGIA